MFDVLFFFLDEKEKIPKEKIKSFVSGAAPTLPFADGAITRFAQTVAPYLRLTVPPLTHLRLCSAAQ